MDNEVEQKVGVKEDVFRPAHEPRTESPTFQHTKAQGHAQQLPCVISGQTDGVEYHHIFCEWSMANAVDWVKVRGVAIGEITEMPVLDPKTDQPIPGKTFPANLSLLWVICKLVELRGFDWKAFDPAKPETFVDSMANMLVLTAKFHRGVDHGIHAMTFEEWLFQAFPRIDGFVYTPDELPNAPASAPAVLAGA